mmetsp:Transcript_600/g.715  ORF Transcript_600/g.715 Transcript_600/m.715 type:complete len:252 (-) Transcript_600:1465-2220(-)
MKLDLKVLSLRYSSWSIRAWLALKHAGADFTFETVELETMKTKNKEFENNKRIETEKRKKLGSVIGLFPVLHLDDLAIHESLAIAEFAADLHPEAHLWPESLTDRAYARAISQEMATGFLNVRDQLSCHVFARVKTLEMRENTKIEVERIKEIWKTCLDRTKANGKDAEGPFLFGKFSIADCMYFPVVTRFRTYNVPMPAQLESYCQAMENQPAVKAWLKEALKAPELPIYDEYILSLGGDPNGGFDKSKF